MHVVQSAAEKGKHRPVLLKPGELWGGVAACIFLRPPCINSWVSLSLGGGGGGGGGGGIPAYFQASMHKLVVSLYIDF